LFPDDRALAFGVLYARELGEEDVRRADRVQAHARPERGDHLLGLVRAQETGVDEDALEPVSDRARHERGGHGGIDPAGERADRAPLADALAELGDRLVDEGRRGPVAGRPAHPVDEVAENLGAVGRVRDFRMELHRVAILTVGHRGDGDAGGASDRGEAAGGRRTVSPWLTQARSVDARPSKIAECVPSSAISSVAGPYSRLPSATTSPPRTRAMSCMP